MTFQIFFKHSENISSHLLVCSVLPNFITDPHKRQQHVAVVRGEPLEHWVRLQSDTLLVPKF